MAAQNEVLQQAETKSQIKDLGKQIKDLKKDCEETAPHSPFIILMSCNNLREFLLIHI